MKILIFAAVLTVSVSDPVPMGFDWSYLRERVTLITSSVVDVSSAIVNVARNDSENIIFNIASQVDSSKDDALFFLQLATIMIDSQMLDLDSSRLFFGKVPLILDQLRTDLWATVEQLTPAVREEIHKILGDGIMTTSKLVHKTVDKIVWRINWKALRAGVDEMDKNITEVSETVRELVYPEYSSLEPVLEDTSTLWILKELAVLDKLPPLIRDRTLTFTDANEVLDVFLADLDSYRESILGIISGRVSLELYYAVMETLDWRNVRSSFFRIYRGDEP